MDNRPGWDEYFMEMAVLTGYDFWKAGTEVP